VAKETAATISINRERPRSTTRLFHGTEAPAAALARKIDSPLRQRREHRCDQRCSERTLVSQGHQGAMSAYLIYSYTVTDPDAYQQYPASAMPTLAGHDVEVLVADYESETKEGTAAPVTVVLRFDSKEAAMAWYDSDAYQAIKHLRTENSEGSVVLCDGFVMPG
jgi:uncharacterized protein (DUF1330 family)